MKVHLIEEAKEEFKAYLKETDDYREIYKFECLKNYKDNWDLNASDLPGMYDKSFSSRISSRLWGGRRNSAKSFMLEFFNMNSEFMVAAFSDLFDESKDVVLRMNRFKFYCDEMLGDLQKKNKKASFHHHNLRMISLYLSFQYPESYCVFDYKAFSKLMERFEVPEIPQDFEIGRFYKLAKAIGNILGKDKELMELHQKQLFGDEFYKEPTMLLVHDFMIWNRELVFQK